MIQEVDLSFSWFSGCIAFWSRFLAYATIPRKRQQNGVKSDLEFSQMSITTFRENSSFKVNFCF